MKIDIMGFIIAILMLLSLVGVIHPILIYLKKMFRQLKPRKMADIFEHNYIEARAFYLYRFKIVPNTTSVDSVDVSKVFGYIRDNYGNMIVDIYQSCFYNRSAGVQQFNKTLFVLKDKMIIELAVSYARILFPNNESEFADHLIKVFNEYKLPDKEQDFEINIITYSANNGLDLKRLDIKPMTLDLGLYYNDDFKEVDSVIKNRLGQQNDKGIVLLHGLPGTGKTTYLRHLIGEMKKKVLFVSPSVAGNLMNPEFIDLLIDNPNSILIIEDAENIIKDRKYNSDSSVSNLLNLSDGLLSDCLSVQIICTFNSSLNMIDSALMRKGRLIAKYEFSKLNIDKAQKLSDHLGFTQTINRPMTIAEIANPDEKDQNVKSKEIIGFKIKEELMN